MVRKMKCPFCGNQVSVSSHWETATCNKCHQNFEITVDIFELSDAEHEKEMDAAKKKIQEEELRRDERAKETKKRLRAALHLPEADPHAGVEFEDDEKVADETPEKQPKDRKKIIILGGLIGTVVLFVLIFALVIGSALKKANAGNADGNDTEATPSQTTQTESVETDDKPTVEENDGEWVDGYSIDSNNEDGKYMIDLQSSDGEQKEVTLTPDVVDESTQAETEATAPDAGNKEDAQSTSNVEEQRDFSDSSAAGGEASINTSDNIEPTNAKPANVQTDEDATNSLRNGDWN